MASDSQAQNIPNFPLDGLSQQTPDEDRVVDNSGDKMQVEAPTSNEQGRSLLPAKEDDKDKTNEREKQLHGLQEDGENGSGSAMVEKAENNSQPTRSQTHTRRRWLLCRLINKNCNCTAALLTMILVVLLVIALLLAFKKFCPPNSCGDRTATRPEEPPATVATTAAARQTETAGTPATNETVPGNKEWTQLRLTMNMSSLPNCLETAKPPCWQGAWINLWSKSGSTGSVFLSPLTCKPQKQCSRALKANVDGSEFRLKQSAVGYYRIHAQVTVKCESSSEAAIGHVVLKLFAGDSKIPVSESYQNCGADSSTLYTQIARSLKAGDVVKLQLLIRQDVDLHLLSNSAATHVAIELYT